MMETLAVALLSALIISSVSFVGAATFVFSGDRLKKLSKFMLALAAGAMLGNVVLHMLPHALDQHAAAKAGLTSSVEQKHGPLHSHDHAQEHTDHDHGHAHDHGNAHDHDHSHRHGDHDHGLMQNHSHKGQQQDQTHDHGHKHPFELGHDRHDHKHAPAPSAHDQHHGHDHQGLAIFATLLLGFFALLGLDLTLLSVGRDDAEGVRPLGYLVLVSDGLENFIDGLIIGSAYMVSVPAGIAATVAVFLHEFPVELSDMAVLMHAGFNKGKALLLNFLSACLCLVGVALAVILGTTVSGFASTATPFAAGAILYLAAAGLIPQLRSHSTPMEKAAYFGMAALGVGVMALILLLE